MNFEIIELILVNEEIGELNPISLYIYIISPLGLKLLGKKKGDLIKIQTTVGEASYEILDLYI